MELTPLDIRNQTFHSKRFGGYDPEEVKAFLETAAHGKIEKQTSHDWLPVLIQPVSVHPWHF